MLIRFQLVFVFDQIASFSNDDGKGKKNVASKRLSNCEYFSIIPSCSPCCFADDRADFFISSCQTCSTPIFFSLDQSNSKFPMAFFPLSSLMLTLHTVWRCTQSGSIMQLDFWSKSLAQCTETFTSVFLLRVNVSELCYIVKRVG